MKESPAVTFPTDPDSVGASLAELSFLTSNPGPISAQ